MLRSHLLLFFKNMSKKNNQLVQDLILPPSTHKYMCTLYTYANTYVPRFSPSGFFGPSKCLVPTPGLSFKYPTCSVYACVRNHTYTPTYTHRMLLPPSKNRENTNKPSIFPHVKKNFSRQQQVPKTQKNENSNLYGFELYRPSSKGTKLLLQVIKAIINQCID